LVNYQLLIDSWLYVRKKDEIQPARLSDLVVYSVVNEHQTLLAHHYENFIQAKHMDYIQYLYA